MRMADVVSEIHCLRGEVAELKTLILQLVAPAVNLTAATKAKLIEEAYNTGDRAHIAKTMRTINGE